MFQRFFSILFEPIENVSVFFKQKTLSGDWGRTSTLAQPAPLPPNAETVVLQPPASHARVAPAGPFFYQCRAFISGARAVNDLIWSLKLTQTKQEVISACCLRSMCDAAWHTLGKCTQHSNFFYINLAYDWDALFMHFTWIRNVCAASHPFCAWMRTAERNANRLDGLNSRVNSTNQRIGF